MTEEVGMYMYWMVLFLPLGCTVGKAPAPAWGAAGIDTGTGGSTDASSPESDTSSPLDFEPSAAPGCDFQEIYCYLYIGSGWSGLEESACAASADSRGAEMTYLPEGCPEGALAFCELPALEGYPGTEYLLISYNGAILSTSEASCEADGGSFTRL